jgi:Tfp pilus assembly protein PilW
VSLRDWLGMVLVMALIALFVVGVQVGWRDYQAEQQAAARDEEGRQ